MMSPNETEKVITLDWTNQVPFNHSSLQAVTTLAANSNYTAVIRTKNRRYASAASPEVHFTTPEGCKREVRQQGYYGLSCFDIQCRRRFTTCECWPLGHMRFSLSGILRSILMASSGATFSLSRTTRVSSQPTASACGDCQEAFQTRRRRPTCCIDNTPTYTRNAIPIPSTRCLFGERRALARE